MKQQPLSDLALLTVVLGGERYQGVAEQLLGHCRGQLRRVLALPESKFVTFKGLSPNKYRQLHSVVQMYKNSLNEKLREGEVFNKPALFCQFLQTHLSGRNREYVVVIYLDNQLKMIDYKYIFKGNINRSSVHIREIARYALNLSAVNIVIAHNHPSGDPTPSKEDIKMTAELKRLLSILEMSLIDHFIVGDTKVVSFREQKLF